MKTDGPRLLIMNTVQSAAVLADDICREYGRRHVEHLSTALLPKDRANTIDIIKHRLEDKSDKDWVLVATSCVEAGMDFSFRTGFREMASLFSLVQVAGQINRNGEYKEAEIWSFRMQDDAMISKNPSVKLSAEILENYFREGREITPELCTDSIEKELKQGSSLQDTSKNLLNDERCQNFKSVRDGYKIIACKTVPVIVDKQLAEQIKQGYGTWRDIQKESIAIYENKIGEWKLETIVEGLYMWRLHYDKFLGYMAGVLKKERGDDF